MMLGIETEVVIFFYAALTGMVLFCGYQILLLIRRLVRHHPLAVGVEDIGFWLLVSAYVFRQMYCTTYGSIRWFFVLGECHGDSEKESRWQIKKPEDEFCMAVS